MVAVKVVVRPIGRGFCTVKAKVPDHEESVLMGEDSQRVCFFKDRRVGFRALRPGTGMGDGKKPRPVRIQLIQDGFEVWLQQSIELVTDNPKVRQLHVGVQHNHHELGLDLALGRNQQTGKQLKVKACLNDHASRLCAARCSRTAKTWLCG